MAQKACKWSVSFVDLYLEGSRVLGELVRLVRCFSIHKIKVERWIGGRKSK